MRNTLRRRGHHRPLRAAQVRLRARPSQPRNGPTRSAENRAGGPSRIPPIRAMSTISGTNRDVLKDAYFVNDKSRQNERADLVSRGCASSSRRRPEGREQTLDEAERAGADRRLLRARADRPGARGLRADGCATRESYRRLQDQPDDGADVELVERTEGDFRGRVDHWFMETCRGRPGRRWIVSG